MTATYSRAAFLRALGIATAGAALGPTLLAGGAAAQPAPGRTPAPGAQSAPGRTPAPGAPPVPGRPPGPGRLGLADLSFDIVARHRPFALLAEGFVQLDDPFDTDSLPSYRVIAPGGTPGALTAGGGTLRIGGERAHTTLLRSDTRQVAPFSTVVVDVAALGPRDTVVAGLLREDGDGVLVSYDREAGQAAVEVVTGGQRRVLGTAPADLTGPFSLAFVVNENEVTALADTGAGPQPLVRRNVVEFVDLRAQAVLAASANAFGVRSPGGGETVLDRVQAGYWGQAGVRDPHVVTDLDGAPVIRDGKLYLTLTQAGLGFFQQAHWGVFTLDLASYELSQVAILFFTRGGRGLVFGDHAGHLVLDGRRTIVANSTWGDFGRDGAAVQVNYTVVDGDVLSGVHVIDTQPLPLPLAALPSAAVGQWDPHIVRIRGQLYVAFVNARAFFDFYPALATGRDLTTLQLVGADASKNQTEGPVLHKIGGTWYVLTSSGDTERVDDNRYPVYDLQMGFVQFLDAPHPTNIPWPMVTPVPAGPGATRYILTTFNSDQYREDVLGYGTHGDFFVMEADRTSRGVEFPPRGRP